MFELWRAPAPAILLLDSQKLHCIFNYSSAPKLPYLQQILQPISNVPIYLIFILDIIIYFWQTLVFPILFVQRYAIKNHDISITNFQKKTPKMGSVA